jgi:hypothetical protein
MRVKLICKMVLLAVMVALVACGGKYADAEKVYGEFADAMEAYLQELDKAADAAAVADAINGFADDMETLAPRMKEITAKYPELKDPQNVPENLKPSKERSDQMAKKMAGTFMSIMKYMGDEKVRSAFERLGSSMTVFGK